MYARRGGEVDPYLHVSTTNRFLECTRLQTHSSHAVIPLSLRADIGFHKQSPSRIVSPRCRCRMRPSGHGYQLYGTGESRSCTRCNQQWRRGRVP